MKCKIILRTCLVLFSLLLLVTFTSCSTSRMVSFVDEGGGPVEGAGLTPYPIKLGGKGNLTDKDGEVRIYESVPEYLVEKQGYVALKVIFAEEKDVYILVEE